MILRARRRAEREAEQDDVKIVAFAKVTKQESWGDWDLPVSAGPPWCLGAVQFNFWIIQWCSFYLLVLNHLTPQNISVSVLKSLKES